MQTPVGNTDPVARAVLALTGNELFHAGWELPEQTDWAAVFDECGRQTVTVHGWKQAKITGILPESVAHAWEEAAVGAAVHSLQVTWEHNDLDARMRQAGIPYVVLKGSASARYYPEPLDRQMGDVDFLVKREDMERAGRLLEEAGFQVRIEANFQSPIHFSFSSKTSRNLSDEREAEKTAQSQRWRRPIPSPRR